MIAIAIAGSSTWPWFSISTGSMRAMGASAYSGAKPKAPPVTITPPPFCANSRMASCDFGERPASFVPPEGASGTSASTTRSAAESAALSTGASPSVSTERATSALSSASASTPGHSLSVERTSARGLPVTSTAAEAPATLGPRGRAS